MNDSAENLNCMLCIRHLRPQDTTAEIENSVVHALAQLDHSPYLPDLADFLEQMDQHGKRLFQTLAAGIDELQELFLKITHQALLAAGVEIDARLTVHLTAQGNLAIEASCAEQEQAMEILATSETLPAILKKLSIQNAVLRNIMELRLIAETHDQENDPKLAALRQSYRVCLKGSLSHFYTVPHI